MKQATDAPIYLLIADGGSSKTDWRLTTTGKLVACLRTGGLNPALWGTEKVKNILEAELLPVLMPLLPYGGAKILIYYYGAGCIPAVCRQMEKMFEQLIPSSEARVASDLLGAARALCGSREGIACILGTGSNSCLYDGKSIAAHIPPLGYVLGDEGSATALGKRLLGDMLKGLMPIELADRFKKQYSADEGEIIRRVYRAPEANRFLASFTPFLSTNRTHPYVHDLLTNCFAAFFERNVRPYRANAELPINFAGGIAREFADVLRETAALSGFCIGKIIGEPIKDLTDYHLKAAKQGDFSKK